MNIAYFLLPKSRTAYLYDDYTVRQGLEKMRYHGYAAIPVISRDGKYVGTVSEGDLILAHCAGEQLLHADGDAHRRGVVLAENVPHPELFQVLQTAGCAAAALIGEQAPEKVPLADGSLP